MTRIQNQVEQEIRNYPDTFFRDIAFPERVVFPLRWLLQNAICVYSTDDKELRAFIESKLFLPMFGNEKFQIIRSMLLTDSALTGLWESSLDQKHHQAEEYAEELIMSCYAEITAFYERTVMSFLQQHGLATENFAWLFKGFDQCRNALKEERPRVNPAAVWQGSEFVIDQERGQVVEMI